MSLLDVQFKMKKEKALQIVKKYQRVKYCPETDKYVVCVYLDKYSNNWMEEEV